VEWLGYSAEELTTGKRFTDLLTAGGRIFYETHFSLMLRVQPSVNEIAFDLVKHSGGLLPALINAKQKRDTDGEPVLNRFTIFNASERRMYERQLLAARDLLRITLASIGDAVVATDGNGSINFMNPVAEELSGWQSDEASGRPIEEVLKLVREDNAAPADNPVRDALRTGKSAGFANHTLLITRGGRAICIDDSASPIRDTSGNIVGGVLVFRDISEKRKAEQLAHARLEQLHHMARLESLGRMAGGIAHDFNNILTGILGYAALLRVSADERQAAFVDEILSAGDRAAGLAQQMLAYAGKGWRKVARIDLDSYLGDHLSPILASVSGNVKVNIEKHAPGYLIEADAGQLDQVIVSLVTNAAESIGDAPGCISLRTGVIEQRGSLFSPIMLSDIGAGSYVVLEVQDTGMGMTPDIIRKIFDPFFTTKFTGRGLGLSAVLGIVKGHGGDIQVVSESGAGSTFRVFLPASPPIPAKPVQPELPAAATVTHETILIVDDEAIIRKLASLALRTHGMRVVAAESGRDALSALAAEPDISAVILDLTMPVMNGEEALRLIKAMRPNLPIIISSGFSEAEIAQRFESSGVAGVLSKPYTVAAIVSKVTNVLRNRQG